MLNCHPISHSALKRVLRNTTAIVLPKNWQVTSAKTASMQAPRLLSVLDPFTLKLRSSLQLSVSFSKALWKSWPHNVVHSQGKFPRWGLEIWNEALEMRLPLLSLERKARDVELSQTVQLQRHFCSVHLVELVLYIFQSICLPEDVTKAK